MKRIFLVLVSAILSALPSTVSAQNLASPGYRCLPGVSAPSSFTPGACTNPDGSHTCFGVYCPSTGSYAFSLVFSDSSGVLHPFIPPSVTGQSGKVLSTDGTLLQWITASSGTTLPSDTGHANQFLEANGSGVYSWATPPIDYMLRFSPVDIAAGVFAAGSGDTYAVPGRIASQQNSATAFYVTQVEHVCGIRWFSITAASAETVTPALWDAAGSGLALDTCTSVVIPSNSHAVFTCTFTASYPTVPGHRYFAAVFGPSYTTFGRSGNIWPPSTYTGTQLPFPGGPTLNWIWWTNFSAANTVPSTYSTGSETYPVEPILCQ